MKIIKAILNHSWVKTFLFLLICFGSTYVIVAHFTPQLISLFNWRSKEFWTTLAIMVPVMFLIPTFVNTFFFLKIVQIADNTQKTNQLLQKQIQLLENKLNK